jgi:hypothetical protein
MDSRFLRDGAFAAATISARVEKEPKAELEPSEGETRKPIVQPQKPTSVGDLNGTAEAAPRYEKRRAPLVCH